MMTSEETDAVCKNVFRLRRWKIYMIIGEPSISDINDHVVLTTEIQRYQVSVKATDDSQRITEPLRGDDHLPWKS